MKTYSKIKNPIIFIGTGRSGTTIISEIINRHPDIAFPSNYQDLYPSLTGSNLIRNIYDNSLWRIHGQKPQLNKVSLINKYTFRPSEAYKMWEYLTGELIDFSRGFLVKETLSEDRINFIRDYFNTMVKFQNKKRLSIKITGPSRISFLSKIFPDAIFVNLKRELIPTTNSFLKVSFWQERGAQKLWWKGVYNEKEKEWAKKNSANPTLLTAFQLNKIKNITQEEVDSVKPKYFEISYENFVKEPLKVINQIIKFTELPNYNFESQLNQITIHNRNKKHSEYFDQETLNKIYEITRKVTAH